MAPRRFAVGSGACPSAARTWRGCAANPVVARATECDSAAHDAEGRGRQNDRVIASSVTSHEKIKNHQEQGENASPAPT